MKLIAICLHCLDMRDFHSHLRDLHLSLINCVLNRFFIPMGRAQGHHQGDSLNAEMTGIWTARFCHSALTEEGYKSSGNCWLPITIIEYLQENVLTSLRVWAAPGMGQDPGPLMAEWKNYG